MILTVGISHSLFWFPCLFIDVEVKRNYGVAAVSRRNHNCRKRMPNLKIKFDVDQYFLLPITLLTSIFMEALGYGSHAIKIDFLTWLPYPGSTMILNEMKFWTIFASEAIWYKYVKSKENDYDDFVIEALGTAVIGSGCPGGASGGTGRLSLTAKWTQNIKFLKIYSKFSRIFNFFFTCNCLNIPIGRI